MRAIGMAGAALFAAMAAACVPRAAPPAPTPVPPPVPMPPEPEPVPSAPPADWMDAALSPGDWRYRGDTGSLLATFASDGQQLILRCERDGTMQIGLLGARATSLILRTTYGERRLPAAAPAHLNETLATLPAADPLLDQMAFSRGRILVQAEGGRPLIVPAWPEIARVAEDCRQ